MYTEVNEEAFLASLQETLRLADVNVDTIDIIEGEYHQKTALLTFTNGHQKKAIVQGDSKFAMILDILKLFQ